MFDIELVDIPVWFDNAEWSESNFDFSKWYTHIEEEKESTDPLYAYIEFITEKSFLRISFSKPMIIPLPYEDMSSIAERRYLDDDF